MSAVFSKPCPILILAGFALCAASGADAQSTVPRRGRAIEFSQPKSEAVSSNLNDMTVKKPAIRSLDANFKKPFEVFGSGSSLDGVMMPPPGRPPRPAVKSKQAREKEEKRKDWIFLAPEDYAPDLSAEEMLHVSDLNPEEMEKKKLTPLERYYLRLEKAQSTITNAVKAGVPHVAGTKDDAGGDGSERDEGPLDATMKRAEHTLKGLSDGREEKPIADEKKEGSRSFAEFFGFVSDEKPAPQPLAPQAQEARATDFKQLLDTRFSPSPSAGLPGGTLNPLAASSAPMPPASKAFSAQPPLTFNSLNPVTPTFGAPLLPGALPESVNNPFSSGVKITLPGPEPARTFTPPTTFSIPQRRF